MSILPVVFPKHNTGCAVEMLVFNADEGSTIVTPDVLLQPFMSVTVTLYVPAVSPFKFAVVAPLLHSIE